MGCHMAALLYPLWFFDPYADSSDRLLLAAEIILKLKKKINIFNYT